MKKKAAYFPSEFSKKGEKRPISQNARVSLPIF